MSIILARPVRDLRVHAARGLESILAETSERRLILARRLVGERALKKATAHHSTGS
jgi:hypothetical protein